MFCTVLPSLTPKMLMTVSSAIIAIASPFCIRSLSAKALPPTMLAIAVEKATARAALEPEEPRMKLEKPLMKATRSP